MVSQSRQINDGCLCKFICIDKFYKTISNRLLSYDFVLKPVHHIKLVTCDRFVEGTYIVEKDQILLCSNILVNKDDFNNAIKRHLIKMYDYKRSTNYDCDNCKHLACTEIRGALFHT